jgi:alanyl-tRNA synthetase
MAAYTTIALKKKIMEMYPEIREHDFSVGVAFSEEKNAYIVTFKRGEDVLSTHLEKKDADECMQGIKCVYLGIQVAQFIKNFEERKIFGQKAA